jgi:hypothetical protein
VRNSARVGEQTAQTKKRSRETPLLASESMFGVERSVFPLADRSPQPWSSVRITTTLGRGAAARNTGAGVVSTAQARSSAGTLTRRARIMIRTSGRL